MKEITGDELNRLLRKKGEFVVIFRNKHHNMALIQIYTDKITEYKEDYDKKQVIFWGNLERRRNEWNTESFFIFLPNEEEAEEAKRKVMLSQLK